MSNAPAIWRRPVKRPLEERRVELAEKIGRDIEAYLEGGPDLEAEHLAAIEGFAGELESEDWKEQTREAWRLQRLALVKPKPKEPKKQEADDKARPEIDPASSVSGRPDVKAEGREGRVALPSVVAFKPPSNDRASYGDAIAEMNDQHAIIENYGNKTVIASWETSPLDLNQPKLAFHSKESFLLRYSNRTVMVERPDARGGYKPKPLVIGGLIIVIGDSIAALCFAQATRKLLVIISTFGRDGASCQRQAIGV